MIGIVPMLIATFLTNTSCNAPTDQRSLDTLSASEKSSYPSENQFYPRFRSARDTSRIRSAMLISPKTQQHADHNLTLLADLCPYADICDKQGRELPRKSLASCCLPCSCDSTCKKMGNCCHKRESYDYMCHSPTVKQSEANETVEDGYFMIDKCLDGSERDLSQRQLHHGALYTQFTTRFRT